jgi:hypothetical protein
VAPVFLLLGIGDMLGVMTGRLSRALDRARVLEEGWKALLVCTVIAVLFLSALVLSAFVRLDTSISPRDLPRHHIGRQSPLR